MTDLRIYAAMAEFNARRIWSGIAFQLYQQLGKNGPSLKAAISHEKAAIEAYRKAMEAAGDAYRFDLDISNSDTGHWRDELALHESALRELENLEVANHDPMPQLDFRSSEDRQGPTVEHQPITHASPNEDLVIRARIDDQSGVKQARVLYRGLTQFQDYEIAEMERIGDFYVATIPAEKVNSVVEYDPNTGALWDFMYLIETVDSKGNGRIFPSPGENDPYLFVKIPHKSIEETGGVVAKSRIQDRTYLNDGEGAARFRIISPVNGDEFMPETGIILRIDRSPPVPGETSMTTVSMPRPVSV